MDNKATKAALLEAEQFSQQLAEQAQQRESDRLIIGQLPLLLDRHPEVMQAIASDYILHTHKHLIDLVTKKQ